MQYSIIDFKWSQNEFHCLSTYNYLPLSNCNQLHFQSLLLVQLSELHDKRRNWKRNRTCVERINFMQGLLHTQLLLFVQTKKLNIEKIKGDGREESSTICVICMHATFN